jgi:hypothetical protein
MHGGWCTAPVSLVPASQQLSVVVWLAVVNKFLLHLTQVFFFTMGGANPLWLATLTTAE